MHKTQMYENLMDMLEREVKEISNKSQLDAQTLDNLYKIMMSIKATDKHMETLEEEGMSQERGRSNARRSYGSNDGSYGSYDGSYGESYGSYESYEGRSNARRGGGRSRDNFRDSSYRGRESYEGSYGYSRDNARSKMVNKLSTLLDDTMSESERNAIMDCIEKIK